jgi:uncharacterized membrane protein
MSESPNDMDDVRIEAIIGRLLQIGVAAAMAIVACGGVIYLAKFHNRPADHVVFVGEPAALESLVGIFELAARLDPRGVIQLGVLVLIATPIARVIFSIYGFWRERDRLYMAVTVIVLLFLFVGLI